MGFTQGRTRRTLIIGAFAAAAIAAPVYAAVSTPATTSTQAECLSWLGARGTGTCIGSSNSNSSGVGGGVPDISIGGPNSGSPGLSTGPLFPGNSWNIPLA